jgi:hypothetical protein
MSLVAGVDGRRGGGLWLVRFTDAGLIDELTWDVVDVRCAARWRCSAGHGPPGLREWA